MRRLFIMRKDLNMSPGKLAAQVAHCAEAYWTRLLKNSVNELFMPLPEEYNGNYYFNGLIDKEIFDDYICGIFTKTICEAKNKNHLLKAVTKAEELGLVEEKDFGLIRDNCLTELEPEDEDGRTLTGIWFKPLPDDVAHEISKKYQLYK